jgi:hypothetical protein
MCELVELGHELLLQLRRALANLAFEHVVKTHFCNLPVE